MEAYRKAAQVLYDGLRLGSLPIGVKYQKTGEAVPEGFISPSALGQKWSLCQAFTFARVHRGHAAMTAKDNFCLASTVAHGWMPLPVEDLLESQRLNKWRRDMEAELAAQSLYVEVMSPENQARLAEHIGFITAPVATMPFEPDSVLVYGNPAQITHIIQALSYDGKNLLRSPFNGYCESCIKGALLPYLSGKSHVVIPGAGDRAFSGTGADEVAVGMTPGALLSAAANLFRSGEEFNLGYPVKSPLVGHLHEDILPGWTFLKRRIREEAEKAQA
ncbi:MAG: DUF169 domain-containing protein [Deltaproteobacteria bacterium]|nr:DUF169 domain-containing protein [Deltaproteobacteria bacterium]